MWSINIDLIEEWLDRQDDDTVAHVFAFCKKRVLHWVAHSLIR